MSDRFGRRPVLLAGLALFLAGTLLCGAAWSLPVLIVGRVLAGARRLRRHRARQRAIIRDVYEREAAARGSAIVMMTMTLVPGVSPAIGAYLAEWIDWRAIFACSACWARSCSALTVARLTETNPPRRDSTWSGWRAPTRRWRARPPYVAFALCGACTSASWFTFLRQCRRRARPDLLDEPPSTYGLMILLPMATYMLGNGSPPPALAPPRIRQPAVGAPAGRSRSPRAMAWPVWYGGRPGSACGCCSYRSR